MDKKIYAIKTPNLNTLIETLNEEGVTKEDIVDVLYANKEFVVLMYK